MTRTPPINAAVIPQPPRPFKFPKNSGAVTTPNREDPLVRGLGGLYGTVPSALAVHRHLASSRYELRIISPRPRSSSYSGLGGLLLLPFHIRTGTRSMSANKAHVTGNLVSSEAIISTETPQLSPATCSVGSPTEKSSRDVSRNAVQMHTRLPVASLLRAPAKIPGSTQAYQ